MTTRASLWITGVPTPAAHFREVLVMEAQALGLETIAAGHNKTDDMPGERDYQYAARVVEIMLGYARRGEPMPAALLVNLFASSLSEASRMPGMVES